MVAVLFVSLVSTTTPPQVPPLPPVEAVIKPEIAPERTLTSKEEIDALIDKYALKYGVSAQTMRTVIKCESQYQNIQSRIVVPSGPNGREDSWGLVQIHLPSHPAITKAEALTPAFAIEFMAKELSEGNGWKWTCFRNLYQ